MSCGPDLIETSIQYRFSPAAPSSSASSSPSSVASNSLALVQTGLPSGTIAALVLAGVLLFFIAICALLYFFLYRPYRRRRQALRRPAKDEPDAESILVVDVAPDMEPTTKKGSYNDPPVAGPSRDRTSRRSGFAKWKEEVEGGLGSWGRNALGIAFRHSDSTGRRDASGASHDYDLGAISDGYKSTSSNSNSDYLNKGKGKGKSRESGRWPRRRSREKSLSPKFKLDLPLQPRSRSRSQSNTSAPADPSVISSLSYLSSPSLRPATLSSVAPSPARPSPRPSPYPNTHSRVGSEGILLAHVDGPQPELEPERRPPLPAPTTSLPLPPLPIPAPPAQDLPPDSSRQDDRGSVREYDIDDSRSILGDGTARIALRSLSPRTSEAEHRTARTKRRTKEKTKEKQTTSSPLAKPSTPPEGNPSRATLLDTNLSTSPFQVNFDQTDPRTARLSTQSRVRFEEGSAHAEGDGQGGDNQGKGSTDENPPQPSRTPFRLTPLGGDHLRDTSFLDFASSSEGSIISRSNDYSSSSRSFNSLGRSGNSHWSTGGNSSNVVSLVPPPQSQSRWSATTAPSSDIQIVGSGTSSSGSNNFPFPVSLPPSPHHPEGTFLQPPPSFAAHMDLPGEPGSAQSSLNAHPADLTHSIPTSPTDSDVPMSISDIHFRHSDNSGIGQSLPAHPPLPPPPAQPEEATLIVQRTVGMHASTPSLGNTMLGTPTPTTTRFNTTPSLGATTSRPSPGSSPGRGL